MLYLVAASWTLVIEGIGRHGGMVDKEMRLWKRGWIVSGHPLSGQRCI